MTVYDSSCSKRKDTCPRLNAKAGECTEYNTEPQVHAANKKWEKPSGIKTVGEVSPM